MASVPRALAAGLIEVLSMLACIACTKRSHGLCIKAELGLPLSHLLTLEVVCLGFIRVKGKKQKLVVCADSFQWTFCLLHGFC